MKIVDYVRKNYDPFKKLKVCIKTPHLWKEILLIRTLDDGSLVIDPTAYFNKGNWRFGHINVPPGREGKVNVSIDNTTLVRSPIIGPKFTYHRSGVINIGKAGHANAERLEATPFRDANGHIFTLMGKNLESFRTVKEKEEKGYQRVSAATKTQINTFKLVGYLGPVETYISDIDEHLEADLNAIHTFVKQDGDNLIPFSIFKIKAHDNVGEFEIWLKIEYYLNFPYNEGKPEASISLLSAWKQEDAYDPEKTVKCLAIIGGN